MNMKNIKVFLLVLAGIWLFSACGNFRKLQKSTDVEAKFKGAVQYYEKKDYYKAGILLEEIIPLLKGTDQAEIASFYYAYCHYHQKQLTLSAYYFKSFYETFPRSQYAEEANYMYCITLYDDSPKYNLDQTNTYNALEAIQAFILQYPETPNRDFCNGLMDKLNKKLEVKAFENAKVYVYKDDWKAALVALENFKKDFPESEYTQEASYLKIVTQYTYAKNSIAARQKERYNNVIEFYLSFVDKYPNSKFLRQAESYYNNAQAILNSNMTGAN